MLNITNLGINTAFTAVKNKIPDPSKYIFTPEFNTLTKARLAQANFVNKNNIAILLNGAKYFYSGISPNHFVFIPAKK